MPWISRQFEADYLFLHWPVPADAVRSRVPDDFELDTFDGETWLSLICFRMVDFSLRLLGRLGGPSVEPEVDLLTFVRFNGQPGVYFLSVDRADGAVPWVLRKGVGIPYHAANVTLTESERKLFVQSTRRDAACGLSGSYGPLPGAAELTPPPGSREHFLMERFDLYAKQGPLLFRAEQRRTPRKLREAFAEFEVNTVAEACGLGPAPKNALAFYCEGSQIHAPPPMPIRIDASLGGSD